MPKKISFTVAFVSSEDDKNRASELEEQGPGVRGWVSAKDPTFPQHLVLKLEAPSLITQVQILAHQYLIPERLELWVGRTKDDDSSDTDIGEEYLGYITLSDNTATGYRSRELKSISVPALGHPTRSLKLVLTQNHPNLHNPHNQVSLVGVQVLGEAWGTEESTPCSPFDDLAFAMYVDRDVARVIRSMDKRKEAAVKSERFTYAGKLKAAMLALREVGEKLGRLEVGKWQAIAQEDYTRANRKKEQAEALRKETYLALAVHDLLEEHGVVPKNDEGGEEGTDSTTTLSEEAVAPPPVLPPVVPASPVHPSTPLGRSDIGSWSKPSCGGRVSPARTGSLRRRDCSQATNSYEAYDERALPPPRSVEQTVTSSSALKMNDREKKQAALPISVFGVHMVEKFYSRHYPDKEEGLRALEGALRAQVQGAGGPSAGPNRTARAAVALIHRALRDKVFSVYSAAAALTTYFFSHFVSSGKVSTAEVSRSVDKILPELLSKSGDSTPRVHNTAVHTILSMAHAPELRKLHMIPCHLTRALNSSTHPRLALSRLEMVEQLILSLGISNDKQSGMTCRVLAELGASGLHHPAEPVRKVAERVLVEVYRVNPRLVRKQLPPDDDITRRNLLYRHLMTEFDKIDLQRRQDEGGKLVRSGSVVTPPCGHEPGLRSSLSTYAASCAVPQSPPPDKQCIFCLGSSGSLTEEGLNIHYWKYCPMLTRCLHCQEVVEVSSLDSHMLSDCQLRSLYSACPSCRAPVEHHLLEQHTADCPGGTRCPFCGVGVDGGEAAWRAHLTPPSCSKHPRAKYFIHGTTPREGLAD